MQTFVYPDPQSDEAWDFVDDEDLLLSFAPSARARGVDAPLARLPVLGPPPSEGEAADATQLLRHSLQQFGEASAPGSSFHSQSQGEYFRVLEPPSSSSSLLRGSMAVVAHSQGDFSASAASLVAAARANAASHRNVLVTQALELFTSNESVQRAVSSLACDPSVWRAVSNNPEVRRLISGPRLLEPEPQRLQHEGVAQAPADASSSSRTLGLRLQHILQGILQKLSDLRSSLVGGLVRLLGFHSADEGGEDDADTNKHVVPGIVTVLVLVIAIIVLKRPILL